MSSNSITWKTPEDDTRGGYAGTLSVNGNGSSVWATFQSNNTNWSGYSCSLQILVDGTQVGVTGVGTYPSSHPTITASGSCGSGTHTITARFNGTSGVYYVFTTNSVSTSHTYTPTPTYTHTITYDANGGSGAPQNQSTSTTTQGSFKATLSATRPTKENCEFLGWSLSAGSTSATYQPSEQYTFNSQNVTLYAVWKQNGFVKVNGTWKSGTYYVKVDGVWKAGAPKIKVGGVWK